MKTKFNQKLYKKISRLNSRKKYTKEEKREKWKVRQKSNKVTEEAMRRRKSVGPLLNAALTPKSYKKQ